MYLELKFVLLANHDQNNVLEVFLVKLNVVILCKVGIELKQEALCLSAWLDRSKDRLDRSKLKQNDFLQIFPTQP